MTAIIELRKAQTNHEHATAKAKIARRKRNDAICEALDYGFTHAQIAEATGLTRGRIGQLAGVLR